MSRTDGQINRWTDEQDWFYRTPTTKMEVQSCSLEIRKNFLKLFGLIVSNMERINTRKGNTINRQIHWFLFLSVIVKKFMLTKSSWKFKTSSWIPNHGVLNQTLNNTDFYLSTFAATKIESSRILFHHYQHVKIVQSICSIHQIICDIHLVQQSHDL